MVILCLALAGLSGCAVAPDASQSEFSPVYGGVETRLLDEELVDFRVTMTGARDRADVSNYALCAAAQYTLIRGFGFLRHVRTNVDLSGGVWTADAVYTISPVLPQGLRTLDAEVTVGDCAEQNIPTV